MSTPALYDLAYREAVRALDHQLAAATELRGRASALIATASIAVSLLGPRALHGTQPFGWVAIGSFVLLGICVLVVVWPWLGWRSGTDPRDLVAINATAAQDPAQSALAAQLELITHLADDRDGNATFLARTASAFRIGACLLAIQVLSTVAAVTIGA